MKRFLLWVVGVILGVAVLLGAVMTVSYSFTGEGARPAADTQFGGQALEVNGSCWQVPLLGGVFGAVSFYDAITGASAMTGALFQVSPVNTFILCVGMRVLMGVCVGLIFNAVKNVDKPGTWRYIVSAMCAPALNTLFFMGYIVLAFYGCDYVQNLVSVKGAANPFMFVVLLVGVQGVAEFLVSGILGGIVARAVHKFLK